MFYDEFTLFLEALGQRPQNKGNEGKVLVLGDVNAKVGEENGVVSKRGVEGVAISCRCLG